MGLNHVGAVNGNGDLYTWGHGFYGQLGHNDLNTYKLPKKVEFGEIKFDKIKCGTYQTLAIDKRELVYIWGRALTNLSLDKNKVKPEMVRNYFYFKIEDFKVTKGKSIQVGYGNSLILNKENEVFGCGDNDCGKAGGDLQEKHVVKNPKYIKFENDSKIKISIEKIFCGYHSCFAISVIGEIYAWGNPRNFRLSHDFGDKVLKNPKVININWKNDSKTKKIQDDDDEDKEKDTKMQERDIFTILNSNLIVPDFLQLFVLYHYII